MSQSLPRLYLNPHAERRLRIGHAWVFSNEVDTKRTPLKSLAAGELAAVLDARGKAVGTAYVNPNALIAARMLSTRADAHIDVEWLARRLRAALQLREAIYTEPYYRLAYGESDGLPGLVVDRYGDICVAQCNTAGMDRLQPMVIEALQALLCPRGILLRNDSRARAWEGLPALVDAAGDPGEVVEIAEGGLRFSVPIRAGQKTGWFYDQRDNRDRLARYVRGARVLDVFSYVGAWALRALAAGAATATCVDSSEFALNATLENAGRNRHEIETLPGDALHVLRQLHGERRTFDVLILDPPALIKRKKDHAAGLAHYAALNRAAMQLLVPGGVLVSCACSSYLAPEELQRVLLRESRAVGRRLQILEQGGQGPDHPVHPAIPETRYLKAFFCRVN